MSMNEANVSATVPTAPPVVGAADKSTAQPIARFLASFLLVAGLTTIAAGLTIYAFSAADPAPSKSSDVPKSELNADLFAHWPKDQKPEAVLFLTAEMNGYLQKCGCSDPQKGGLERRWNVLKMLRDKGWEVLPLDLGDVTTPLREKPDRHVPTYLPQVMDKYETTMRVMRVMGYKAVGIGLEDFALDINESIAKYTLQNHNEYPRLLAANVTEHRGAKRDSVLFNGKGEPAIRDWEIYSAGKIHVGVVGLVGDPIVRHVKGDPIVDLEGKVLNIRSLQVDSNIGFAKDSGRVILNGLTQMAAAKTKPEVRVLLYQGPDDFAKSLADGIQKNKQFPNHFDIVLCRTKEAEPPTAAHLTTMVGKSMLIQVGHKGQHVAAVGLFRNKNGGLDMHYQRIVLSSEFDTPVGKEKENLALVELERYSALVRDNGYLGKYKKTDHPLQVINAQAKYVGSAICAACHNAAMDDTGPIWNNSKHAVAYNALSQIAKKPSLRNFDGECIVCHTVGFKYQSGFTTAKATPQLMHVGCESCHGPGSQHSAAPKNAKLALEMSPWKSTDNPKEFLPTVKEFVEKTEFKEKQKAMINRVDQVCQTCHTSESDPHFTFESFWPKIAHGNGQKPIPPKKK